MRTEDLQVQVLLTEAGYGDRPIANRDEMDDTLAQILREDQDKDRFVDRLREILSTARKLDSLAELTAARSQHNGIKACPCGRRPDTFGYIDSDDQVHVVCLHETEAVTRSGATLNEAIANWNLDDWTDSTAPRTLFPL